jgi:hypothetical protein
VYVDYSRGFRLDISHMYVVSSDQINPHYYLLFLYRAVPLIFNINQLFLILVLRGKDES